MQPTSSGGSYPVGNGKMEPAGTEVVRQWALDAPELAGLPSPHEVAQCCRDPPAPTEPWRRSLRCWCGRAATGRQHGPCRTPCLGHPVASASLRDGGAGVWLGTDELDQENLWPDDWTSLHRV